MHEDIDDFEPDMDAFYRMSPEERSARRHKYNLFKKYSEGKITYERYISQLESSFYEYLDHDEWEEVKKYKEQQEKAKQSFVTNRKIKENTGSPFLLIFFILFLIMLFANMCPNR